MREGNLNSRTTPQGSPPEAVRDRASLDARLTTGYGRILDFKFPSRSAPPSKQCPILTRLASRKVGISDCGRDAITERHGADITGPR